MRIDKLLGYLGFLIVLAVIIYLILRIIGVATSVSVEEILLSFAGRQALLDVYLIKAIGRLEGRLIGIEKRLDRIERRMNVITKRR